MRDAEKNRDPVRAQKRAKNDAKCALRKMGLMDRLEKLAAEPRAKQFREGSRDFVMALIAELGL